MPADNRTAALVAPVALALSGFAALVYEICWMRLSALAFGSTVYATSTVLAVFFGGLALGAEWAGRASARLAQPLRRFAILELALALLGALSPAAFGLADRVQSLVYGAAGDAPALLALGRLVMVAALVLVPATCMGAGLPLCARAFAGMRRGAGVTAAALYAANTLGALAGCLAAGFFLLPRIGMQQAVLVAAGANVVAALLALASARDAPLDAGSGTVVRIRAPLLGALVFTGGAVALANEVLWTRYLGLVVHNSVYTYTLSLAVVLAGIVLGSALLPAVLPRLRAPAVTFGALQVAIGLLVVATAMLPPAAWQSLGGSIATSTALMLPPALLSGASLPLAVHLLAPDERATGAGVGRLYALNTAGGIAGALLAGFVLLPVAGLEASLLLTSGASVAAGLVAWRSLASGWPARRRLAAGAASIAAFLALPVLAGTHVPEDFLAAGRELVDLREAISADVAVVREEGELQLEIDRWWQGSARKGHQAVAAHLPMLMHPDPRRVLVIGAGAGQTPGRMLMYGVERVDVVDIEPAVFTLIEQHFESAWMRDPRVRLLRDDGRNHVVHGADRYDVASIEVGQISRPGVASLYTREFYARARERLEPGGLLVQFVPLPFFTVEEFRAVVRTFIDVFPASTLWYNTAELLLIGRNADGLAAAARLLDPGANDAVARDLEYSPWGGPAQWLSGTAARLGGFLMGPRGLAAIAEGGELALDDRPWLEYATARPDPAAPGEREIVALLAAGVESVRDVLALPIDDATLREAEATRTANLADIGAAAELRAMRDAQLRGDLESVLSHLRAAVGANPRNVQAQRLLGDTLVTLGRGAEAQAHYREALAVDPADAYTHRGLAYVLQMEGRNAEAIRHYRLALDARPGDAEAHNNLGTALASSGDLAGAKQHFDAALRLRPGYADAERNLERLRGSP